jgi:uncharacterized protein
MIPLAQDLAREYGADEEIVSIAVITERSYPADRMELVKKCVLSHRGSVNVPKASAEEVCVADADAIVHMTEISSLFYAAYRELGMSIEGGTEWIRAKVDRDWQKMSPRAQAKYKSTYEMLRELLA